MFAQSKVGLELKNFKSGSNDSYTRPPRNSFIEGHCDIIKTME